MFGVRLNTVNVSGSLYLNVIVQGIMNALCLVSMWTVDIPLLGRRGNIVGFMMLTGVSLLTMVLVPECKSSSHQYIVATHHRSVSDTLPQAFIRQSN